MGTFFREKLVYSPEIWSPYEIEDPVIFIFPFFNFITFANFYFEPYLEDLSLSGKYENLSSEDIFTEDHSIIILKYMSSSNIRAYDPKNDGNTLYADDVHWGYIPYLVTKSDPLTRTIWIIDADDATEEKAFQLRQLDSGEWSIGNPFSEIGNFNWLIGRFIRWRVAGVLTSNNLI